MRKVYLIFLGLFLCTNVFGANVRSSNATIRQDTTNTARQTSNRSKQNVTKRSAVSRQQNTQKVKTERSAVKTVSARSTPQKTTVTRSATNPSKVSRATVNTSLSTRTFGSNYETCRDAYFTCMDQFCATQNDKYRRCVCSSRLQEIQDQESLLSQTANSLQDFNTFNIDAITKTAEEVKAMQSASAGETGMKEDKSQSATMLKNIKEVLNTSKQNALSTNGKLDIAGDIKSIWKTTDLIRGYDIATLSGESLYNAVNAQCSSIVAEQCASSDLKMVASAYGMYIENDCELLAADVKNKTIEANASIRSNRHDMQDARLENYNAHNSLSLHDCIAKVRQDITAETACGTNYIHCMDVTGKYLSTTGEPIYSPEFYKFENQISLSGDVLKNSKNTTFVNALNKKQKYAAATLDTCRDVADNVWDEFLRQAIVEIYQGQLERVQQVKNECLQVVNQCYLDKSDSLKELSADASELLTRQTMELSEELCKDKLDTCSNLYGGGPEGLNLLVSTMTQITDNTIAQQCPTLLQTYAEKLCAVSANDTIHSYPYGCRTYAPGESRYASTEQCNITLNNPFNQNDLLVNTNILTRGTYKNCPTGSQKRYKSCNYGHYLFPGNDDCPTNGDSLQFSLTSARKCCPCPDGYICPGGTAEPSGENQSIYAQCGLTYIGSLYQKLVLYALQNCTRTTNTTHVLPQYILADVEQMMEKIRVALIDELATECNRLNGVWVTVQWKDSNQDGYHDTTNDTLLQLFYISTNANKLWGYCKQP